MTSRKEEERHEKIIRGLMKLPPNRRCINCNSLGPQYVCTNFWTFVCMTCSGIHREFTHRVKSVSMAKFTSQEVEALQNGGNQRAREIYLKEWDPQRLRLPDNSKADKIREFIKNVYIDKKFDGGKSSDRPVRDSQKQRSYEGETRRASSYHSYSQSPPYDFQYEERRYRGHAPALSRKPGSDRGLYDGKFSSFSSPSHLSDRSSSHFSDRMCEDGFANEQSNSRISDYSASGGGDPFRSDVQSPKLQTDIGSPSSETSRDFSGEDVVNYTGNAYLDSYAQRDGQRAPFTQRTASSGSFGSFDSNSLFSKSINSAVLVDVAPAPEQPVAAPCNNTSVFASLPQSTIPGSSDGLDLFSLPSAPVNVSSTASTKDITNMPGNLDGLDLFIAPEHITASTANISQVPKLSSAQSLDLFEPSISTTPTFVSHQLPQTIQLSSPDLFSDTSRQQSSSTFSEKSADMLVPQNEGWATFDMPQHSASLVTQNSSSVTIPSANYNSVASPLVSLNQWSLFRDITARASVPAQTSWTQAREYAKAMTNTVSNESLGAFEDSSEQLQNVLKSSNGDSLHKYSNSDQFLSLSAAEEFNKGASQSAAVSSSSYAIKTSDDLSMRPAMPSGMHSYPLDCKSTNPFELPYDPEIEGGNTFWDMNSLEAALPNGSIPNSFTNDTKYPWYHQDPIPHYGSEEALGFMSARASDTHMPTLPSQGPTVASIGGNPFA